MAFKFAAMAAPKHTCKGNRCSSLDGKTLPGVLDPNELMSLVFAENLSPLITVAGLTMYQIPGYGFDYLNHFS